MRILVTGSAGHLGEALMRTLRAEGRDAVGLDRRPSPYTDVVGSITDEDAVRDVVRGTGAILHTATLHKPHVGVFTRQDFVDVNVRGTLALLEAAVAEGVSAFVFTSTTSTFGRALVPAEGEPAAWITEDVVPVPKNVYGATKVAAEDLCQLVHQDHGMPCLILKTSRFFPEDDDDPRARTAFEGENLKVNELLYRRVDVEDAVSAHLAAIERAPALGFRRLIVSATTAFHPEDADELRRDPRRVIDRRVPEAANLYARRAWRFPVRIDRVYDNAAARAALDWHPRWDFTHALGRLAIGADPRSRLAHDVGIKGYEGLPASS